MTTEPEAADHDDDEDDEDEIHSPEALLAMLHSEDAALDRIVASPDPRRLANFIQGTLVPLMRESLRTMAVQDDVLAQLESKLERSTVLTDDAKMIYALLDQTERLFEAGAKDLLPVLERDSYLTLLHGVRRLVIRSEEEPDDDDGDDDDDEGDDLAAAVKGAPELQPNGSGAP